MTLEDNKALVRRHYEDIDVKWNLDAVDSQIAPDFVDHASPPGTPPGPAAVKAYLSDLHQAVPDLELTVHELIAEGDRVVARTTWRGTQSGTLWGIPPTGNRFTMDGIVIWRVANGQIAERWATVDQLGLLKQLGVLPSAA
jgi:steroid delta-isomerase-like uncharacterized protein